MRYQITTFRFPRELTQDQEDMFIAAFQAVRNKALEKIKRAHRLYDNILYKRVIGKQGEVVKSALGYIIDNFDKAIILTKISVPEEPCTYQLLIAVGMFRAFEFGAGPLKLDYIKKVEDSFKELFRKELCRKLGFKPDEVKVSSDSVQID